MLKPVICVACEKVIIDQQQSGVVSLIALFDKMSIAVPREAPEIPPNAVAPREWSIFSKWETDPDDAGKEFTVCTQMFYPDKTPFGDQGRTALTAEANKKAQAIVKIFGFPLGQTGMYTIRSWIEANGKMIGPSIEFRLELEITIQEPAK